MGCNNKINRSVFTAIPVFDSSTYYDLVLREQASQIQQNNQDIEHNKMVLDTLQILFQSQTESVDFNQRTFEEYMEDIVMYG
jgi:hypothetical protein